LNKFGPLMCYRGLWLINSIGSQDLLSVALRLWTDNRPAASPVIGCCIRNSTLYPILHDLLLYHTERYLWWSQQPNNSSLLCTRYTVNIYIKYWWNYKVIYFAKLHFATLILLLVYIPQILNFKLHIIMKTLILNSILFATLFFLYFISRTWFWFLGLRTLFFIFFSFNSLWIPHTN